MKSLKLGDTICADGYKAKVYTLPNDDGYMQIILDEGWWTETVYDCNIHDITLDSDGELVLCTEFVPVVGDVIRINEKEYRLVDIDEGVATLEHGDETRYYSFYDITWDIMDDYWISSVCQQVFSPTVKRKLDVYEVQGNVYSYNSLDELKEIYELLGEPSIQDFYGTDIYENLIDSLQHKHGLIYYWGDYDSEREYTYKYMKVIDGATLIGEY